MQLPGLKGHGPFKPFPILSFFANPHHLFPTKQSGDYAKLSLPFSLFAEYSFFSYTGSRSIKIQYYTATVSRTVLTIHIRICLMRYFHYANRSNFADSSAFPNSPLLLPFLLFVLIEPKETKTKRTFGGELSHGSDE